MISHRIYIITLGPEMIQESKCCGSNRSCVLALRASAHERLEPQRFFYRWNETFCFKRKRAHGRLFYRSVFPNTSCFIFCAVRWPHSGWRWQWNTKEHYCLRARAPKQPHGHQYSSAVPSNCTHHGSRLQEFS